MKDWPATGLSSVATALYCTVLYCTEKNFDSHLKLFCILEKTPVGLVCLSLVWIQPGRRTGQSAKYSDHRSAKSSYTGAGEICNINGGQCRQHVSSGEQWARPLLLERSLAEGTSVVFTLCLSTVELLIFSSSKLSFPQRQVFPRNHFEPYLISGHREFAVTVSKVFTI